MADTNIDLNSMSGGSSVDTRTESTNGNHRQVIVLGDPATNAGVAPVDGTAGLKVDLGSDNDVVLAAGTAEIGKLAAGLAEIGNVKNSGTFAVQSTLQTGSNAIGKLAANSGVDIGDVDVLSVAGTVTVDGSGVTQPVSNATIDAMHSEDFDTGAGTDTSTAVGIAVPDSGGAVVIPGDATAGLKVDLGADNDVSVTGTVTVDLGANNDVTVTSGTITANLGATDNAVLDSIDTNTSTIAGDTTSLDGKVTACNTGAVVISSGTVTANLGATDNAVLDDIAAQTSAASVAAEGAALGSGILLQGDDGTNRKNVNVDATTGDVQVDVTNTVTVDLGSNNDVTVTSGAITETNSGAIKTAVELLDNAVDGNYLNTNSNIAGVDILGGAGAVGAGTQRVTLASDDPAVALLGTIDTDTSTIAGDTTSMDGKITACNTGAVVLAAGTAEIGKLAAGTAAIGKLAANSGVDIGDVDVTSLPAAAVDANWFQATFNSADATTAAPVKVKTAAKKIHITSVVISTDTAMNILLQDDNTPTVIMQPIYLAANGGMALTFPKEFPLQVGTNFDLDVKASASGNISVTVTGYVV